ncbi:MAG TPA: hypothetical protein VEI97_01190 [bacterium]|nr:hypothetical protein [bacterium]
MPTTAAGIWAAMLGSALVAYACAALRGWSRRQRWLAVLVGLHLAGPLGWLLVLAVPPRRH